MTLTTCSCLKLKTRSPSLQNIQAHRQSNDWFFVFLKGTHAAYVIAVRVQSSLEKIYIGTQIP